MSAQRTPEPWRLDWERGVILAADGSTVAFMPAWANGSAYGKANGLALAAAPDLLAALFDMRCAFGDENDPDVVAWWEARSDGPDPDAEHHQSQAVERARAAIAKAEGNPT